MTNELDSDVFGVEKEPGKVAGILAAVYQDVFSQEVYPTLEEKAANLLYFSYLRTIRSLMDANE